VMNFTLQFLDPNARLELIQKIYDALLPGGLLFLSEKVHFSSNAINTLITEQYHAFKRRNGYSALEVAQKRAALEKVLRPTQLIPTIKGFSKSVLGMHIPGFNT